jgi:hypothetical protein
MRDGVVVVVLREAPDQRSGRPSLLLLGSPPRSCTRAAPPRRKGLVLFFFYFYRGEEKPKKAATKSEKKSVVSPKKQKVQYTKNFQKQKPQHTAAGASSLQLNIYLALLLHTHTRHQLALPRYQTTRLQIQHSASARSPPPFITPLTRFKRPKILIKKTHNLTETKKNKMTQTPNKRPKRGTKQKDINRPKSIPKRRPRGRFVSNDGPDKTEKTVRPRKGYGQESREAREIHHTDTTWAGWVHHFPLSLVTKPGFIVPAVS